MEHDDSPCAPSVLSEINRCGQASIQEIAEALDIDSEEALNACIMLMGWGSIAPVYAEGDGRSRAYYPETYATVSRDRMGNTVLDGRAFDKDHATTEGEPWSGDIDGQELFKQEKSRTYDGVSFPRRAFILLAGILVNIIAGMLLLMSVYSLIGFTVPQDVNRIGEVIESSPAAEAGIVAGDRIVQIDSVNVNTWTDLVTCLQEHEQNDSKSPVSIVYEHKGERHTADVMLDDGKLGIYAATEHIKFNIIDSARLLARICRSNRSRCRSASDSDKNNAGARSIDVNCRHLNHVCSSRSGRSCHVLDVFRLDFPLPWLDEPTSYPAARWWKTRYRDCSAHQAQGSFGSCPDDCLLWGHSCVRSAIHLHAARRYPSILLRSTYG